MDKNNILKKINSGEYYYINNKIKLNIIKSIKDLFPNLISSDVNLLVKFTNRLIDFISIKFGLNEIKNKKNEIISYTQWTMNENNDIKSTILMLLPFLDNSKDNGKILKDLRDLNNILFNNDTKTISKNKRYIPRSDIIKKDLYNSNFIINFSKELSKEYEEEFNEKLLDQLEKENLLLNRFETIIQTIKICNGKFIVNWLNIRPILIENFQEEPIYKNTVEKVDLLKNKKVDTNDILCQSEYFKQAVFKDYNEKIDISIYNYYYAVSNFCYESIKKIKWTFYCRDILASENNGFYFIQILNMMLNLKGVIRSPNYYDMNFKNKSNFNNDFDELLKKLSQNNGLNINNISKNLQYEVLASLLRFLVSNNSDFNFPKELEKYRIEIEHDEIEDINFSENLTSYTNLYEAFSKINRKLLWDYLKDCLDILKYNYYGSKLFIEKDSQSGYINNNIYYLFDKVTIKNIYNYGKFITFQNFKDKTKYTKKYINLIVDEDISLIDEMFYDKLFLNNINTRNFISRNLRLQMNNSNNNSINNRFDEIKKSLKNNIHKIVWETLIFNGLISKFGMSTSVNKKNQTNDEIENHKLMTDELKEIIVDKNGQDGYYFFTNSKYKDLDDVYNQGKPTTYIKLLTTYKKKPKFNFYNAYSLNWLFQINFMSRFVNQNINYITGATGQGKSTQMPKIYAYCFKALDFIVNPRVICTQPRFDPTESNPDWVSQEVGLDINYEVGNQKIKTNNYYLQFKHSKNKHIKENCCHPSIIYVTDGTILMTLNENLSLSERYYNKRKNDFEIIKDSALYNAVLIDEAHEHNTNMDLILSELRLTSNYNENIKIAIVSATMDDDEPVYRAYYKKYYRYYNIKGIFTDPRIHISPPGKTTKYKITEHFSKDEDIINIHQRTINQVKYILKNYSSGQILVFSTGQADILKIVEELNKTLSSNVITLPYFSAMNPIYKDIIKNITEKLPSLKNKRENVHIEWGDRFIQDKTVSNNIYKRAVIVATNVAEASITIPGLKFVVDNGYQKVRKYDFKKKTKIFAIEKISEASRLQRKGRVGRKEPGDVFYLYPQGTREKILPKFKITQEDFSDILMNIITNKETFKKYLDKHEEDIDNIKRELDSKMMDIYGQYYIVNPFENKLVRNMYNEIIEFDGIKTNKINIDMYNPFFNNLAKNLMIGIENKTISKYILTIDTNNYKNLEIEPTTFFRAVKTTMGQLLFEKNESIVILISSMMEISNEVTLILPLIRLLNNGLKGFASVSYIGERRISNYKKLINRFGHYYSDIYSIYKIVESFKNNFSDLGIFKILDEGNKGYFNKLNQLFNKSLKNYQNYKNTNLNEFKINNLIDVETYISINQLIRKKIYKSDELREEWIKSNSISSIFINEFKSNKNIIKWCQENYISYDAFTNYYKNLVDLMIKIYSLDSQLDKKQNEINYLKEFATKEVIKKSKLKVTELNLKEKLELAFIYGYHENLFFRDKDGAYRSFYSHQAINQIVNSYGNKLTFNTILGEFISCINKIDKGDDLIPQLNLVININPKVLGKYLATIFMDKSFSNKIKIKLTDKKTNFSTYQIRTIDDSSLNNFYYELFNNLDRFKHLLYNPKINNKSDELDVYKIIKNIKYKN